MLNIFIISIILLSLGGWLYRFNKRLTKVELSLGIKTPIPKDTMVGKDVSFIHNFSGREYKVLAKVQKEIGSEYLVSFVQSFPTFIWDTHSPFIKGVTLVPKNKILK